MSIFNYITATPSPLTGAPVWTDRIAAARYGAVEALCLGQLGVEGWLGIATLDKEGRATLILQEACFWQDLGEGGDLTGWVARYIYLGAACRSCGHFHAPEELTMVGRQCDPCVYREIQETLILPEEPLGLPEGQLCPCCQWAVDPGDRFCTHCGQDLR